MAARTPADGETSLEAKAAFLLRLRARGIRSLAVLRALESVPREGFAPRHYAHLAALDIALPLPCGQTMSKPFVVARMVEALAPTPTCRVLEIGAGSGYATAILARLARSVVTLERFRGLADAARERLAGLGLGNAEVVWGDALALEPGAEPFDRIVVHAEVPAGPAAFSPLLARAGVVVLARAGSPADSRPQYLVRATRESDAWSETRLVASRFRPLIAGVSRVL